LLPSPESEAGILQQIYSMQSVFPLAMSPGSLAGWGEAKMIDGWMWLV